MTDDEGTTPIGFDAGELGVGCGATVAVTGVDTGAVSTSCGSGTGRRVGATVPTTFPGLTGGSRTCGLISAISLVVSADVPSGNPLVTDPSSLVLPAFARAAVRS